MNLLTKVHSGSQLKAVDAFLSSAFQDLEVQLEPCRRTSRGWVEIAFSGEDETIALNYLANEIGLCPVRLETLGKHSTAKGYIAA